MSGAAALVVAEAAAVVGAVVWSVLAGEVRGWLWWWAAFHLVPVWRAWRGLCGLVLRAGHGAARRTCDRYEQQAGRQW